MLAAAPAVELIEICEFCALCTATNHQYHGLAVGLMGLQDEAQTCGSRNHNDGSKPRLIRVKVGEKTRL